jgi:hypothetical protein
METPLSVRLGEQGDKLHNASNRTGLKKPDVIKLAIEELFRRYPKDKELAEAVFKFRLNEQKKSASKA